MSYVFVFVFVFASAFFLAIDKLQKKKTFVSTWFHSNVFIISVGASLCSFLYSGFVQFVFVLSLVFTVACFSQCCSFIIALHYIPFFFLSPIDQSPCNHFTYMIYSLSTCPSRCIRSCLNRVYFYICYRINTFVRY